MFQIMNTNIKVLSSEELEVISGGATVGQVVKKIAKVTWKTIEVIGTLGGCIIVAFIIMGATQGKKAG